MPKPPITRVNIMGDSLSDAGTMNQNAFMRVASKVSKSPDGKFTNGMVWSDYLLSNLSNDKNSMDVNLDHHKNKLLGGETVVRSYAIGGATSHATSADWNKGIERKLLSSLEMERKELLKDNRKYHVKADEIRTTLIVEWSGANDIATLSSKLETGDIKGAKRQADHAIQARLDNAEKMIQAGYVNFALFNLPNMANTPRFSSKKDRITNGADEVSQYFNDKLLEGIVALQKKHDSCNIQCFDVNQEFGKIYSNPKSYGFNTDTKMQANNIVYEGDNVPLFNDDVHPSTQAHALIANKFQEFCNEQFDFKLGADPRLKNKDAKELVAFFANAYENKYGAHKKTAFRALQESHLGSVIKKAGDDPEDQLKAIFEHANKEGKRSRIHSMLKHLDMLTAEGPEALVKAREAAMKNPKNTTENSIASFKELKARHTELNKPEEPVEHLEEDIGQRFNQ